MFGSPDPSRLPSSPFTPALHRSSSRTSSNGGHEDACGMNAAAMTPYATAMFRLVGGGPASSDRNRPGGVSGHDSYTSPFGGGDGVTPHRRGSGSGRSGTPLNPAGATSYSAFRNATQQRDPTLGSWRERLHLLKKQQKADKEQAAAKVQQHRASRAAAAAAATASKKAKEKLSAAAPSVGATGPPGGGDHDHTKDKEQALSPFIRPRRIPTPPPLSVAQDGRPLQDCPPVEWAQDIVRRYPYVPDLIPSADGVSSVGDGASGRKGSTGRSPSPSHGHGPSMTAEGSPVAAMLVPGAVAGGPSGPRERRHAKGGTPGAPPPSSARGSASHSSTGRPSTASHSARRSSQATGLASSGLSASSRPTSANGPRGAGAAFDASVDGFHAFGEPPSHSRPTSAGSKRTSGVPSTARGQPHPTFALASPAMTRTLQPSPSPGGGGAGTLGTPRMGTIATSAWQRAGKGIMRNPYRRPFTARQYQKMNKSERLEAFLNSVPLDFVPTEQDKDRRPMSARPMVNTDTTFVPRPPPSREQRTQVVLKDWTDEATETTGATAVHERLATQEASGEVRSGAQFPRPPRVVNAPGTMAYENTAKLADSGEALHSELKTKPLSPHSTSLSPRSLRSPKAKSSPRATASSGPLSTGQSRGKGAQAARRLTSIRLEVPLEMPKGAAARGPTGDPKPKEPSKNTAHDDEGPDTTSRRSSEHSDGTLGTDEFCPEPFDPDAAAAGQRASVLRNGSSSAVVHPPPQLQRRASSIFPCGKEGGLNEFHDKRAEQKKKKIATDPTELLAQQVEASRARPTRANGLELIQKDSSGESDNSADIDEALEKRLSATQRSQRSRPGSAAPRRASLSVHHRNSVFLTEPAMDEAQLPAQGILSGPSRRASISSVGEFVPVDAVTATERSVAAAAAAGVPGVRMGPEAARRSSLRNSSFTAFPGTPSPPSPHRGGTRAVEGIGLMQGLEDPNAEDLVRSRSASRAQGGKHGHGPAHVPSAPTSRPASRRPSLGPASRGVSPYRGRSSRSPEVDFAMGPMGSAGLPPEFDPSNEKTKLSPDHVPVASSRRRRPSSKSMPRPPALTKKAESARRRATAVVSDRPAIANWRMYAALHPQEALMATKARRSSAAAAAVLADTMVIEGSKEQAIDKAGDAERAGSPVPGSPTRSRSASPRPQSPTHRAGSPSSVTDKGAASGKTTKQLYKYPDAPVGHKLCTAEGRARRLAPRTQEEADERWAGVKRADMDVVYRAAAGFRRAQAKATLTVEASLAERAAHRHVTQNSPRGVAVVAQDAEARGAAWQNVRCGVPRRAMESPPKKAPTPKSTPADSGRTGPHPPHHHGHGPPHKGGPYDPKKGPVRASSPKGVAAPSTPQRNRSDLAVSTSLSTTGAVGLSAPKVTAKGSSIWTKRARNLASAAVAGTVRKELAASVSEFQMRSGGVRGAEAERLVSSFEQVLAKTDESALLQLTSAICEAVVENTVKHACGEAAVKPSTFEGERLAMFMLAALRIHAGMEP